MAAELSEAEAAELRDGLALAIQRNQSYTGGSSNSGSLHHHRRPSGTSSASANASASAADSPAKRIRNMAPTSIRVDKRPDTSHSKSAFTPKKLASESPVALTAHQPPRRHSPAPYGPDSATSGRSGGSPRQHRQSQSTSFTVAQVSELHDSSPPVAPAQHTAPLRSVLKGSHATVSGDVRIDSRSPAEFITQPPVSARGAAPQQQQQQQSSPPQRRSPQRYPYQPYPLSGEEEQKRSFSPAPAQPQAPPAITANATILSPNKRVAFGPASDSVSERLYQTGTFASRRKGGSSDPFSNREEAEAVEAERAARDQKRESDRAQRALNAKLVKQEREKQRSIERERRRQEIRIATQKRLDTSVQLSMTAAGVVPKGQRSAAPASPPAATSDEPDSESSPAAGSGAKPKVTFGAATTTSTATTPPTRISSASLSRATLDLSLSANAHELRSQLSPRSRLLMPTQATALKFRAGARIGGFTTGGPARTAIGLALLRRGRSVEQLEILDPASMLRPVATLEKPAERIRHTPASVGSSPFDSRMEELSEATRSLSAFHREKINSFALPSTRGGGGGQHHHSVSGTLPLFESIVAGNTIHHPPAPLPVAGVVGVAGAAASTGAAVTTVTATGSPRHHMHRSLHSVADPNGTLLTAANLQRSIDLDDDSEDQTFEDYKKKLYSTASSHINRPRSPTGQLLPDDHTPAVVTSSFSPAFTRSFAVGASNSSALSAGFLASDPKKAALEARGPGIRTVKPHASRPHSSPQSRQYHHQPRPLSPPPPPVELTNNTTSSGGRPKSATANSPSAAAVTTDPFSRSSPTVKHAHETAAAAATAGGPDSSPSKSSKGSGERARAQSASAARLSATPTRNARAAAAATNTKSTADSPASAFASRRPASGTPKRSGGFGTSSARLGSPAKLPPDAGNTKKRAELDDETILKSEFTKELLAEFEREDKQRMAQAAAAVAAARKQQNANANANANANGSGPTPADGAGAGAGAGADWDSFFESSVLSQSLRL